MFAILVDDNFVGGVGIYNESISKKCAEFGRIVLSPQYQHRGVGTKTLKIIFEIAKTHLGLTSLFLYVKKENQNAIKLYEYNGFFIIDDQDEMFRMIKRI